jgi:hypothetical protein
MMRGAVWSFLLGVVLATLVAARGPSPRAMQQQLDATNHELEVWHYEFAKGMSACQQGIALYRRKR